MLSTTRLTEGDSALAAVVCGNLLAFSFSLLPAWPIGELSTGNIGLILYLGMIQIALAYFLVAKGLSGVTALEASVLLLIEPVFNPLLTWIVHRETPPPLAIFGGGLILLATIAKSWWERDRATPRPG